MRGGFKHRVSNKDKDKDYRLKDIDIDIIKTLLHYIKPYTKKLFFALLAMLTVSVTTLIAPFLLKIAIDDYIVPGNENGLLVISIVIIITYTVLWLSSYWQKYLSALIGQGVIKDIRQNLMSKLMNFPLDFYARENTGNIMARLTHDAESLSELVSSGIVFLLNDIITLTGIIIIMFYLNSRLALITMLILPFITIGITWLGNKMRDAYQEVRRKMAELNTDVEEKISGIKLVQSLNREDKNIQQFTELSQKNLKANLKAVAIFALFFPAMNLTGVLGTGIILWVGGKELIAGNMSLGVLSAFAAYVSRFFFPLRELSQVYNTYQAAASGMERIKEYLDIDVVIKGKKNNTKANEFKGLINISNLSFRYQEKQDYILKDINLNINPGEIIAIIGPSGAGKTTLIRLIAGLYNANKGEIRIDSNNIEEIPRNILRNEIIMVPQNVYLFPGTIAENIAYGKANSTRDEIFEAAKKAQAHQFIQKLSFAYDTEIGEAGVRLSGGQKQLISFARALLINPRVIILDEATSSVDNLTEKLIQEAMEELFLEKTVIMIAHRFTTLKKANKILVMNEGRIEDMGVHSELMNENNIYKKFHKSQKGY